MRYGGDEASGRDETEYALLESAMASELPVIGVCRGMQLIMDAMGTPLTRVEGHVAVRHRIVGLSGERTVNSYHTWAATTLAKPLRAVATCGDVIEAIDHEESLVSGIMWHPEREPALIHWMCSCFVPCLGQANEWSHPRRRTRLSSRLVDG